jgi:outer membrane protein assembly factor BamD (BamD/ComL family)
MRQNIKISKREMKEDKFTTFMLQSKEYIIDNWVYFAGGLAAVIIIIAGLSLMKSSQAKGDLQASEVYNRAMTEFRSGNHQLAIVDFKTVVDEYGSSVHARDAAFNLGNAYFSAGNYAEAKTAFENYMDQYSDNEYFTTSAIAGIAASLAGVGENKNAADKYREAAEKFPDFKLAGQYYVRALEYYLKAEEMESARVIYAILAKDYEGTQYYLDGALMASEHKIKL